MCQQKCLLDLSVEQWNCSLPFILYPTDERLCDQGKKNATLHMEKNNRFLFLHFKQTVDDFIMKFIHNFQLVICKIITQAYSLLILNHLYSYFYAPESEILYHFTIIYRHLLHAQLCVLL